MEPDECGAVSLVKNAAYFLPEFLKYHLDLGVRHILIIDNGSSDDTVAIAQAHPSVTVVRNTLPVRRYENLLRSQLARRYFKGGWLLFLDSDEMFSPPTEGSGALRGLCRYANAHGYSAVVCQVLDMVSDLPLAQTADMPYAEALARFRRYSLTDIERFDYFDPSSGFAWFLAQNRCVSREVQVLFGGIRKRSFGENCCLTTHRLVRNLPEVGLYAHPHVSVNVDCADVTALIRHYKFCGDIVARETRQVSDAVWGHGQDRARMARLTEDPDFRFDLSDTHTFSSVGELYENGFLVRGKGFEGAVECRPQEAPAKSACNRQ